MALSTSCLAFHQVVVVVNGSVRKPLISPNFDLLTTSLASTVKSNFAPVQEIGDAVNIVNIEGNIPVDFPNGIYIRNGPNPVFGGLKSTISVFGKSSHTWVEGEGMVHALNLIKDGHGSWIVSYKNRYVETETLKLEMQRNKLCFLPAVEGDTPAILAAYVLNLLRVGKVNKFISNTNIFEHSRKFYAIAENHLPQEIDINTLGTFGSWDVNGAWNDRPFTSHPKKAPGTGELIITGVDALKPYFVLGVISADGKKLVHKVDLKFNRSSLCHDMGVTQKYNVIIDSPLSISINRLLRGGSILKYDKEGYARIGVMPRYGDANSVLWFQMEPHCTLHILNCFEDGDEEVVVRGCKARESIIPGPEFGLNKFEWFSRGFKPICSSEKEEEEDGFLFTRLYEWRLNMKTGGIKQRYLTGTSFSLDFPFINLNFVGIKNKYGYVQVVDSISSSDCGNINFLQFPYLHFEQKESQSGSGFEAIKVEYHKLGKNTFCSGAAFVPNPEPGSEEDDGWIISYVHNEDTNISQVHIIDAKKFESEPVAKITLPQRVPYGFHGTFASI
ncbi:Carotenoid oxygenase [Macleaya cordata]|uniref:Carotenoid oxygenase n=1 Tax=Macleaya cordata TaxID=56857 RepID=A0A200RC73_MACCD|nr:Carotenoid oxygenase [Macleaya cordata]